jgi:hypothetical protein
MMLFMPLTIDCSGPLPDAPELVNVCSVANAPVAISIPRNEQKYLLKCFITNSNIEDFHYTNDLVTAATNRVPP